MSAQLLITSPIVTLKWMRGRDDDMKILCMSVWGVLPKMYL